MELKTYGIFFINCNFKTDCECIVFNIKTINISPADIQ